jgi:hypothetical protein
VASFRAAVDGAKGPIRDFIVINAAVGPPLLQLHNKRFSILFAHVAVSCSGNTVCVCACVRVCVCVRVCSTVDSATPGGLHLLHSRRVVLT